MIILLTPSWLLKNAFQTRKIDLLLNGQTGFKYDVVDSKTGRYISTMSNRAFNDIRFSIKKSCKLPARLYGLYMFEQYQDVDSICNLKSNDINVDAEKYLNRNTLF